MLEQNRHGRQRSSNTGSPRSVIVGISCDHRPRDNDGARQRAAVVMIAIEAAPSGLLVNPGPTLIAVCHNGLELDSGPGACKLMLRYEFLLTVPDF
jgi:hypothetical protein